jgi:hypothetical protein
VTCADGRRRAPTAGYDPRIPYGLGVQAVSVAGHRRSATRRFLGGGSPAAARIAIAVLTNQSRSDPNPVLDDPLRPPWCRDLTVSAVRPPPDIAAVRSRTGFRA